MCTVGSDLTDPLLCCTDTLQDHFKHIDFYLDCQHNNCSEHCHGDSDIHLLLGSPSHYPYCDLGLEHDCDTSNHFYCPYNFDFDLDSGSNYYLDHHRLGL